MGVIGVAGPEVGSTSGVKGVLGVAGVVLYDGREVMGVWGVLGVAVEEGEPMEGLGVPFFALKISQIEFCEPDP